MQSRGGEVVVERLGRCCFVDGPVVENPFEAVAASHIHHRHVVASHANRQGLDKIGHGEVVGQVQAENGVVAVAAVVVLAVCTHSDWEVVAATAAGTDSLIECSVPVEAARSAVHVVAAAVIAGP